MLDAWITDEPGTQIIRLTKSVPYTQQEPAPVIDDATITLYDETSGDVYPFTFSSMDYQCLTSMNDSMVQVGHIYRLRVEYDANVYEARDTVRRATTIERLVLASVQQARAQTAQTETLFSNKSKNTKIGAYGVPAANLTSIDGNLGVMTGGYGGVLLNRKWMIGAGAYSLVNNITSTYVPTSTNGEKQYLSFWYTGLAVEYTHNTDKLIHWTAGALIGGGAVSRRNKEPFDLDDDHDHWHSYDRSGAFVAGPFANVELNITSYLRLDLGADVSLCAGFQHT